MINNKKYTTPCFGELGQLKTEGWTDKMYKWYCDTIEKEKTETCFDKDYLKWAHAHGFYAENACSYSLNEQNSSDYLSDFDYLKVWPLNGWTRIWVNDKMTLKYMLANTEFDKLMPKYYYYSTPKGLRSLVDNPFQDSSEEHFIEVLKRVGEFACKPCNGTTAIGFVKLTYKDGAFYINSERVESADVIKFVNEHPNYVFTEYLRPSKDFVCYSDLIHTLRLVTLNEGSQARIIGGYLRLPCNNTGEANYSVLDGSDTEKYNLFVNIDINTGEYGNAVKTFANRIEPCIKHPDSGVEIKGIIKDYSKLKETVLSVANRFNTLEWLGFDIGVTDNGFKCMEINTHPGIKYMQIFKPLLSDDVLKDYFSRRLWEINQLSETEKKNRAKILR